MTRTFDKEWLQQVIEHLPASVWTAIDGAVQSLSTT